MNDLDRSLFLLINAYGDSDSVTFLAYLLAKYVIYAVPSGMFALWVGGRMAERRRVLLFFFGICCAVSLSFMIGVVIPTTRPFLVPLGSALMEHRASPSFPSNHGIVMFTLAWIFLLQQQGRKAAVVGAIGLLVACSRVYLGIHWPSDMIGAFFVSAIAAYVAILYDRWIGFPVTRFAVRIYEKLMPARVCRH